VILNPTTFCLMLPVTLNSLISVSQQAFTKTMRPLIIRIFSEGHQTLAAITETLCTLTRSILQLATVAISITGVNHAELWLTRQLERQITSHQKFSVAMVIVSVVTGGLLVLSCMNQLLDGHHSVQMILMTRKFKALLFIYMLF
jgi:hypothetical protein